MKNVNKIKFLKRQLTQSGNIGVVVILHLQVNFYTVLDAHATRGKSRWDGSHANYCCFIKRPLLLQAVVCFRRARLPGCPMKAELYSVRPSESF